MIYSAAIKVQVNKVKYFITLQFKLLKHFLMYNLINKYSFENKFF